MSLARPALLLALLPCLALAGEPAAPAVEPGSPAPASAPAAEPPGTAPSTDAADARLPPLGVLLDLGVPAGSSLSLVYRPIRWFRVFAGPAWDYLSFGVQGGMSFSPWDWKVAPCVEGEVGRYFDASASRFVHSSGNLDLKSLLQDVGYQYAALHLGFEVGSQRGFTFSLRAGLAWAQLAARGTSQTTSSDGTVVTVTDPKVRAVSPSVKLGFQYFF
ncbi:MAG TPA: hypothetical protein VML50_06030 [Anaeromyxobacter sp.]|nr:hypothetical protein [Anaeromyxobacter sp.]